MQPQTELKVCQSPRQGNNSSDNNNNNNSFDLQNIFDKPDLLFMIDALKKQQQHQQEIQSQFDNCSNIDYIDNYQKESDSLDCFLDEAFYQEQRSKNKLADEQNNNNNQSYLSEEVKNENHIILDNKIENNNNQSLNFSELFKNNNNNQNETNLFGTEKSQEQQQQQQETKNLKSSSGEELAPFEEEDFVEPECHFDMPDFSSLAENKKKRKPKRKIQEDDQSSDDENDSEVPLWKVNQKIKKERKQKDYDKNICRYITRCIVRCFVHDSYKSQVLQFCEEVVEELKRKREQEKSLFIQEFESEAEQIETDKMERGQEGIYQECKDYILGQIEGLNGHRALKELLCFNDQDRLIEKIVFRRFSIWFLKERSFRYIISGNMKDKQSYLRYKNKIMLYYINKPEQWNTNYVRVRKRR